MLSTFSLATQSMLAILAALLTFAGSASAETVIYSFLGSENSGPDGSMPYAGLIAGKNGNLYGTTYYGGEDGLGTVFELAPPAVAGGAWTETVLYSFHNETAKGGHPDSGLIFDEEGNLYGAADGGPHSGGILFQLTPPTTQGGRWAETVLHNFPYNNGEDGTFPSGGLTFGRHGVLYGVTELGGASGVGTVFQLKRSSDGAWSESVLYSFADNGIDGIYPISGVVVDSAGNLYGTTADGGGPGACTTDPYIQGCGVFFELSPPGVLNADWGETILHSFTGINGDGEEPFGKPIFDSAGNLYAVTASGGSGSCPPENPFSGGCGTVFELSPSSGGPWTEQILYSFTGGSDGEFPHAGPVFDQTGNLYGTASGGGSVTGVCSPSGCGTIFSLSPPATSGNPWSETTLHQFGAGRETVIDGSTPYGGLIFDKYGALYGTTLLGGGSGGFGTVFRIQPF